MTLQRGLAFTRSYEKGEKTKWQKSGNSGFARSLRRYADEKQRDFLGYYYNDDLSLSEIAENEGITRQGVRDAIKRAEAQLLDMESKLKLASKFDEIHNGLSEIIDCAGEIGDYNLNHSLSREVNDYTVKIKAIAMSLME